MSALFKATSLSATAFSDGDIKKMSDLWIGNSNLGTEEIKQKWRDVIGDTDADTFLKRLALTVLSRKERIKRLCKVDPDSSEQFERDLVATLEALKGAFTYN